MDVPNNELNIFLLRLDVPTSFVDFLPNRMILIQCYPIEDIHLDNVKLWFELKGIS